MGWESIDQVGARKEGIIPKILGHGGLGEECETGFDDVAVLALRHTILLGGMWTRDKVLSAMACKERGKCLIFTTPIGLDFFYFCLDLEFNFCFEFCED